MFNRSLLTHDPSRAPAANPLALAPPWLHKPRARQLRDRVVSRYDEAISYAMPGRDGLNAGPDQSEVYDDTAMLATPEFASRIQQGVIPNFSQWASFIAGVMIEDEDTLLAMGQQLEKVDTFVFELINSSNFQVEAHETFLDLAIGTACMRIDEAAGTNPFNSRAVPLRGLDFCIGPDGRPDPIFETRMMTRQSIAVHWPNAAMPSFSTIEDPTAEWEVVECWQRDWSRPTETAYRMTVYLPGKDNHILMREEHEGEGCCPYIVFRWSKSSGEGWGRGPLFQCLPSMRKVNFVERAALDHTDVQIGGIWTMEDDGVVNVETVRLEPGVIVPSAPGSTGLRNVAPSGNFDMAMFQLENSRQTIRKALYTEQLGNPNKTPMSATEVSQRMAELARAIGSSFGRLILEFVMPAFVRFVRIAKDRKLIELPTVDGRQIKLISTSPLAQAQRFEDIEAIDKFLATVGARLGMEMLNVVVDGVEVSKQLATSFQVPKAILRGKAQREQIIAAITQGAAAAQEPAPDGEAAPS